MSDAKLFSGLGLMGTRFTLVVSMALTVNVGLGLWFNAVIKGLLQIQGWDLTSDTHMTL